MLKIYFGNNEKALRSGDGYFDNWLDDDCLETEFAKEVVRAIDKSELISKNLVQSPVIGAVPPKFLSGGTKSLLILRFSDVEMNITAFGENCYPYIIQISKEKDITICSNNAFRIFECGDLDSILILNDESFVHSDDELIQKWLLYRSK